MAQAEINEVLSVGIDKLWDAIVRYEDYPSFVEGCTGVKVERKGPGQARAAYNVSMIKDITYQLDHKEDKQKGLVEWTLVDSDFMKKNNGRWILKSLGPNKTDVTYSIEIEFNIAVPGFILNRLVKGNLPAMLKGFEKRAKSI